MFLLGILADRFLPIFNCYTGYAFWQAFVKISRNFALVKTSTRLKYSDMCLDMSIRLVIVMI